jgi:twinkle protein
MTWNDGPKLGQAGVEAMERRQIGPETVERFGLFTAGRNGNNEVVPDLDGNIVAFPFRSRAGKVVNHKYRGLPFSSHEMWQSTGGEQVFWNEEILDDPALERPDGWLLITEGEIDALTAIDCDYPFTVSVPSGAVPVPKGARHPTADLPPLDPATEATGKFAFMHRAADRLEKIHGFILALDADPAGQRMTAEILRRLNPLRCRYVTYPAKPVIELDDGTLRPCKDLNEVRMEFGPDAVRQAIADARPCPIVGLYRFSEFPQAPEIEVVSTPWWTLDEKWKPFLGSLVFVLGIPGHGKSLFVANMLIHFAETYGWRSVMFSPEEPAVPLLRAKMRRMRMRREPLALEIDAIAETDRWLDDKFLHITTDPANHDDDAVYLDWVLDRATDAVKRDDVKVLAIDPWNEVDETRQKGESQTQYIARAIRSINRWRHQHNVMVIITLHPIKDVSRDGKVREPTPGDADGSAAFFNKADFFISIYRANTMLDRAAVRMWKRKFEGTGEVGTVTLRYDRDSCRYELLQATTREEIGR